MRRPRRDREGEGEGEHGMSALEVVLLAPLVIGFIMVLVSFGILVNARGNVQGAARDAARMGSLQRDYQDASKQAQAAAAADLGNTCAGGPVATQVDSNNVAIPSQDFAHGGLYTVKVTCVVSLAGLDWFSLGNQTITAYSTAPLDTYRRTGTG